MRRHTASTCPQRPPGPEDRHHRARRPRSDVASAPHSSARRRHPVHLRPGPAAADVRRRTSCGHFVDLATWVAVNDYEGACCATARADAGGDVAFAPEGRDRHAGSRRLRPVDARPLRTRARRGRHRWSTRPAVATPSAAPALRPGARLVAAANASSLGNRVGAPEDRLPRRPEPRRSTAGAGPLPTGGPQAAEHGRGQLCAAPGLPLAGSAGRPHQSSQGQSILTRLRRAGDASAAADRAWAGRALRQPLQQCGVGAAFDRRRLPGAARSAPS
jgi:hypothetical protein